MAAQIPGRMADREAHVMAGCTLPKAFQVSAVSLAAATYLFRYSAAEAGDLRMLSLYADLNGGTVTVDFLKNGVSCLAATHSLTDDTIRTLEGLGTDTSGEDRDINTNTAANIAKLRYQKGDILTFSVVVAAATCPSISLIATLDERQPGTKFDRA